MFSIALFDSVRANLNETSDQLNSLSALPEIMHLYRYSKFSSLLTSLSRQGKFQLIILQSLSTPFPDLSLARRIRQYDRRVPIIIVTDNESLCLEGYDVPIFQFYTKAMTVQQMRMVLESLMDHAPDMGNRFFIFSSDQSMYQVRLSDITFLKPTAPPFYPHYAKSYACRDTLKNLQTRLRRFPFERIHKSFIVNTKFISCLQSDSLILQDGTVLPVSKHKMAPMRHYLKLLMESSLL
ncbi:LytTR family transcriptional regulator DNA-binding domain-containing protein [Acidaminococcus intestini]|nr:LytTR family transcriptional regulator DNA-binding domain-containing protein [Acidaminococcus intestini]